MERPTHTGTVGYARNRKQNVVILAVAFPGRHLDQRRSRKPAVGVSGKLQEDTGTVIGHRHRVIGSSVIGRGSAVPESQGKVGSPMTGQSSLVKVMGLICSLDAPLSWPS